MTDDRFGKQNVTVTLTGEEWFAIIATGAGKSLSPEGRKIYRTAAKKMGEQVVAASNAAAQAVTS